MKLFHNAGRDNLQISIVANITDWANPKFGKASLYHLGIGLGLIVSRFIMKNLNVEEPPFLYAFLALVNFCAIVVQILRYTFHNNLISIAMKENETRLELMVSEHQLLWVTPIGDIPLFRDGYTVVKQSCGQKELYVCMGRPSNSLANEAKEFAGIVRIWCFRQVGVLISVDAETYPDAKAILEEHCQSKQKKGIGGLAHG